MAWIEGEDRLFMNMQLCFDEIQKEANEGLKKAGMTIIGKAQRNMRTAGYNGGTLNSTGRLSQSGKVQELTDGSLDVGFFSADSEQGYAAYVEYGTRAHIAPYPVLKAWAKKKLMASEQDAGRIAFFVKRKIARQGTAPHPFFAPAVKASTKLISKAISDAVAKVVNKDY